MGKEQQYLGNPYACVTNADKYIMSSTQKWTVYGSCRLATDFSFINQDESTGQETSPYQLHLDEQMHCNLQSLINLIQKLQRWSLTRACKLLSIHSNTVSYTRPPHTIKNEPRSNMTAILFRTLFILIQAKGSSRLIQSMIQHIGHRQAFITKAIKYIVPKRKQTM